MLIFSTPGLRNDIVNSIGSSLPLFRRSGLRAVNSPPAPAVAQYAEEWHEWHGQQWNGGPGGLPPRPGPSLGYQYGAGYPAPGSYDPDHSYGYYPYPAQPFPSGYSAGFSEGFAAGYDHGFTGGLNNAFAGAYDSGYAGRYGYGSYGYPYPYQGY